MIFAGLETFIFIGLLFQLFRTYFPDIAQHVRQTSRSPDSGAAAAARRATRETRACAPRPSNVAGRRLLF